MPGKGRREREKKKKKIKSLARPSAAPLCLLLPPLPSHAHASVAFGQRFLAPEFRNSCGGGCDRHSAQDTTTVIIITATTTTRWRHADLPSSPLRRGCKKG